MISDRICVKFDFKKKLNIFGLVVFYLCCFSGLYGDSKILIDQINKQTSKMEKEINSNQIPYPYIKTEIVFPDATEGVPPVFKFFYKDNENRLCAVKVYCGHETWGITFYYFFDQNEKIMKYLEEVNDRPDNPPRRAIIYNTEGKIIWKNRNEPRMDPDKILRLFKTLLEYKINFSGY